MLGGQLMKPAQFARFGKEQAGERLEVGMRPFSAVSRHRDAVIIGLPSEIEKSRQCYEAATIGKASRIVGSTNAIVGVTSVSLRLSTASTR